MKNLLLIIIASLLFAGCDSGKKQITPETEKQMISEIRSQVYSGRFIDINVYDAWWIYVDIETRVQYLMYSLRTLAPLIGPDGKPILYQGPIPTTPESKKQMVSEIRSQMYSGRLIEIKVYDAWWIYVDIETRVQYLMYSLRTLAPLIGPDGKPILYDGPIEGFGTA